MRFSVSSPDFSHKAVWARSMLLALLAALLALPAAAQTATDITAKFDDAVREAWNSGSFSRVIMRFASTADRDRAYNELLNKGAAVRKMDGEDVPSLNVYASPAAFGTIDYAERISYDAPVQVAAAATQTRAKFVRGLGVKVAKTIYNRRGTGVTVAVIDSGYQPHPDIAPARILKFKDFVTGGTTPVDGCGHGTHVAGIIGGSGLVVASK